MNFHVPTASFVITIFDKSFLSKYISERDKNDKIESRVEGGNIIGEIEKSILANEIKIFIKIRTNFSLIAYFILDTDIFATARTCLIIRMSSILIRLPLSLFS